MKTMIISDAKVPPNSLSAFNMLIRIAYKNSRLSINHNVLVICTIFTSFCIYDIIQRERKMYPSM